MHVLVLLVSLAAGGAPTVYQRLCEVNPEWRRVTPDAELLAPARFHSEAELLRGHLGRVADRLEAADASALDPARRQARAHSLAALRTYLREQECPHNEDALERVPVMVDSAGRHCPVAALMAWDGQEALVQEVARTANHIRIRDIHDPRFWAWAEASGLSADELAWIQPAYTPDTHWHVAARGRAPAPSPRELRALPRDGIQGYQSTGALLEGPALSAFLAERGISEKAWAALAGPEDSRAVTAGPVVYRGQVYVAGGFAEGAQSDALPYLVQRWTGQAWEPVGRFPVPILALSVYRGRLYVGGGRNPFLDVELPEAERDRAFISSYDGAPWQRLRSHLEGEVRGFASLRGHLCAAVTYYIPPR